eukprot:TRINITY_DN8397_c0_g2_i1.p1 TRINITY_DN8397_c0_g2~~TRINITY_DN8397_c0_g2_i1.p1  ORF type:complete len:211 (-),score=47.11 TRINITY_DN8397_c0_g2_i1:48-680(-)
MSNILNVCILGEGGVGKSAIATQFCSRYFIELYDPTIEESHKTKITIDKQNFNLEILDTAGQECKLREGWILSSDVFLLVFSIAERSTFERIYTLHKEIVQCKHKRDIPCLIVGNKSDLFNKRQVSVEEGKELANYFYNAQYHEVSAKSEKDVLNLFKNLVRLSAEYYPHLTNTKKKEEMCYILNGLKKDIWRDLIIAKGKKKKEFLFHK